MNVLKNLIEEYLEHCELRKELNRKTLKAFFHHLVYEEILELNPFDKINIRFREPQRLPRTIPFTTIERFMSVMYKEQQSAKTDFQKNAVLRDIAVIELLFATGMRISELCMLKTEQVDLTSHKLLIYGKGAKERMLQIGNQDVVDILTKYYSVFENSICPTGWYSNTFNTAYVPAFLRNTFTRGRCRYTLYSKNAWA